MHSFYEGKYLDIGYSKSQWCLLPTIVYNPKPYRYAYTRPVHILFLTFYILLGKERG